MASEPDAYGHMGTGLGLIAAACAVGLTFITPLPVYSLVPGLFVTGLVFFFIGRSHEKAIFERDQSA